MNQNQAKAIYAFRNNGTKAPISVMFEMETTNQSTSVHGRMISRGLGGNLKSRLTVLMNYTEELFNEDFGKFDLKADDVNMGYRNALGEVSALKLDYTSEQIFGEAVALKRIDTTNVDEVSDAEGNIKLNWSVKKVEGQELTHEGALIYTTVEFCEVGESSIRLKQDQDLSVKVRENVAPASLAAAF